MIFVVLFFMMFLLAQVCAGVYVVAEGGWTKGDVGGEVRMRLTKASAKPKDPKLAGVEEPHVKQNITMTKNIPGLNLGLGYRWSRAQCHMALELGCRYHNTSYVASVPDMQKFEELDIHQIYADAEGKVEPQDRGHPRDAYFAQGHIACVYLQQECYLERRDLFDQHLPLYT